MNNQILKTKTYTHTIWLQRWFILCFCILHSFHHLLHSSFYDFVYMLLASCHHLLFTFHSMLMAWSFAKTKYRDHFSIFHWILYITVYTFSFFSFSVAFSLVFFLYHSLLLLARLLKKVLLQLLFLLLLCISIFFCFVYFG